MRIITASPEHFPIIKQIAYDTWPHTFGDILSSEQIVYMLNWMYDVDSIKKQVNELGHVFILAEENDIYYGYASYEIDYKGEPATKIHKIYILPSAQGKGIGKALIAYIEVAARQCKNKNLTLNVNRNNKAITFYERIGFIEVGQEDIDIGKGFLMQDLIMKKEC
jgi:GNAT superfamily N-acetyltransferase